MTFSTSKEAWQEKEIVRFRERIREYILADHKPIKSDQEHRWSTAYKELEALREFIKTNKVGASPLQKTGISRTIKEVGSRIGVLHSERGSDGDEGVGEFALMYLTWECAMRLSKQFEDLGIK
jgi:hypothetical protein